MKKFKDIRPGTAFLFEGHPYLKVDPRSAFRIEQRRYDESVTIVDLHFETPVSPAHAVFRGKEVRETEVLVCQGDCD